MNELQRYLAEEIAVDHADGFITRREALRRHALLGVGAYLLCMGVVAYAIRSLGGQWGVYLELVFLAAAQVGYRDLVERSPELSLLAIGINWAVPMVLWMRFRGHQWRPTLEMASTSIILPILLIGAAWLGIIPESSRLILLKIFACPVMLIPMLFRLDLYTLHHESHQHQAHEHRADEHADHIS